MTLEQTIPLIAACISAGCALYVTLRTSRWRETDDGRRIEGRFKNVEDRVTVIEARHANLPTSAEMAALHTDLVGTKRELANVGKGLDRLEGWLIKMGLEK